MTAPFRDDLGTHTTAGVWFSGAANAPLSMSLRWTLTVNKMGRLAYQQVETWIPNPTVYTLVGREDYVPPWIQDPVIDVDGSMDASSKVRCFHDNAKPWNLSLSEPGLNFDRISKNSIVYN